MTGVAPEHSAERPRGEQTRTLIVETALRLFRERGYDKTTMRAIAAAAGVSVGNAYYYFASKEHLVQAFYEQIQEAHEAAARPVLAGEDLDFAERLRGVMSAWIDVAQPYHEFAGKFFKVAAEPRSPLSPFSTESSAAREGSIALFRQVVEGSSAKVGPELRDDLPRLLWLAHMGVVLFWVHDTSPGCRRTRVLVEGAVPMIGRLVQLSRLRVLRSMSRDVVELMRSLGDSPQGRSD